jgi:hypothetical protein
VLVIATLAALALAAFGLWQSRQADDRAATARRQRNQAVAARRAVDARTERTSHVADGPIGAADRVQISLSKIFGASGSVIDDANSTDDALARAVDLANRGNLGAARDLYGGEAAADVQKLRVVLDQARTTLAVAQAAVVALAGQAGQAG